MTLFLTLFIAGILTILLPCILPLVPVVLGVSLTGRHRLRPLAVVGGMVLSFVVFTVLLLTLLRSFVTFADLLRIGTFAALFLFGVAFLTNRPLLRLISGIMAGFFFLGKGLHVVIIATLGFTLVMYFAVRIAARIQQAGLSFQTSARTSLGSESLVSAFVIGMSLGLVWVPCAGPALGFALTLVRNEPGPTAVLALTSYALGAAVPLLLIGYGGQVALRTAKSLNRITGFVKIFSGTLLIVTALLLRFDVFQSLQIWLIDHTRFGDIGTRIEESLFSDMQSESSPSSEKEVSPPQTMKKLPTLPVISRAPEFSELGPWHNAQPFTFASLKGKVVLIDFWTYSCINCIRTLPHIQGYWEKYEKTGKFVLLGVHSPEFAFEKNEKNVAHAILQHKLTYPIAQDNNFGTWSAFANRYWPAKYLIDAEGKIRYTHFGEGAYAETDIAIQSLLAEAGVDVSDLGEAQASTDRERTGPITPETYLSSRSWPAFGSSLGDPSSKTLVYKMPTERALNTYYLEGSWKLVDDEAQQLVSDAGEIAMRFQGGEMNLVLGLAEGSAPVEASVTVNGKSVQSFTIDHHDLYNLYQGPYGTHDMVLKLKGSGVEAFAFTFGS